MNKLPALVYRKSQQKDDSFIVDCTLSAMKNVFEQSVGTTLTTDMIRQQLNGSDTTVIVECDGKPIGYYSYKMIGPGRLYWGSLILVPEIRRRGLGKKIVQHVEKEALVKGIQEIEGHVQIANSQAIIFWLKNGFHVAGMPFPGTLAIQKTLKIRK